MRSRRRITVLASILALIAVSIAPAGVGNQAIARQAMGLVTEMQPCATWLQLGTEADGCLVVLHMAADAPVVDVWVDGAASGVTSSTGSPVSLVLAAGR